MVGTLTNQISASSACKVHKARKASKVRKARKAPKVVGKYQDFMLMRFFISIDLIGCGGDINQSDFCKQCVKVRKVSKARKACKAHQVVGKISGFYVNEVFHFH